MQRLFALLGLSLFVGTEADQTIELPAGWSIFSTYMDSDLPMPQVFESGTAYPQIVKNNNTEVYWSEFGFNGIGNITPLEGYQIKLNEAGTITIAGNSLNTFDLQAGLNLVGHISEPQNVHKVFEGMNVNWVKDAYGNLYAPPHENMNDIGDMQPGRGYWVNMLSAETLEWESGKESLGYSGEMYTANGALTNTGNNMNIIFPTEWFSEGSTIGARCSDIYVGEVIVDHSRDVMAMTVWGDDLSTQPKEGCAFNENIVYTIETPTGFTGTVTFSGGDNTIYSEYLSNVVYVPTGRVVPGCTDSAATNYNADATTDDGSCVTQCIDPTDSAALAAAVQADPTAYQMAGLCN